MADREKVILALKIHAEGCGYKTDFCTAQGCPYAEKDYNCDIEQMCHDAVSVLKEQEGTIKELQNAYEYLQKQFFEVQDKLLKEQGQLAMMRMIYGTDAKIVGEIVRCKDCKWFEMPRYGERGFCKNVELIRQTTFYCADGERRE